MIRTVITVLFVAIFLIISLPIQLILTILSKCFHANTDRFSLRFVQGAFRIVQFCSGVKLTVIGKENIPTDRPVLYIGNHRSIFDVVTTYPCFPNPTGVISKKSIEKVPGLSIWMRFLHCLFLDRDDMRQGLKVILSGIDQIKSGISMCVFPEGTRNKTDEPLLPFHAGSFKLAEKTGCPIVPMALTNTADIFENHFPWLHATHVILQFGKPIETANLDKEQKKRLADEAASQIKMLLEDNRRYL